MMKSVPAYAGASPGRPDTHWIRPPLPNSSGPAIGWYRKSGCVALIAPATRSISSRPTVDAPPGIVEHAIFSVDLVDGRAPTPGVVFTEDVVKIARQQGRYAVGHGLSPLLEGARLRPRRDGGPCILCRGTHQCARGRRRCEQGAVRRTMGPSKEHC